MKYSVKSIAVSASVLASSVLIVIYILYIVQYPEPVRDTTLTDSAESLTVQPLKPLYRTGESVEVSGVIGGAAYRGQVELKVLAPDGDEWADLKVSPREVSGSSTLVFDATLDAVSDKDASGVYLITVKYSGLENGSSVLVSTRSGVSTELSGVKIQDMVGGGLAEVRLGDTVMVAGVVVNRGAGGELTFMVEVLDESSRRVHTGYVSANIDTDAGKTFTIGWPTPSTGVFTIYAYVKPDFQSRSIVSEVKVLSFQVNP